MKISDKLLKKYAVLPPPRESEPPVEVVIPPQGKTPEIKDLSEKEMQDWEDFIAAKTLEKEREKRVLEDIRELDPLSYLEEEEKVGKEEGTIPAVPGKKANLSAAALLKMCSQYHDLCHKF